MNNTQRTAHDICLQYNNCYPEDPVNDTVTAVNLPSVKPSQKKLTGKPRDLEGAFKVLHLSDIHVDEFYTPVSVSALGTDSDVQNLLGSRNCLCYASLLSARLSRRGKLYTPF